jgi:nucleotide-binding universal stress UspA family protein
MTNNELIIVGSHGHGRVHHAVLGSISDECVRLSACPVVIIPLSHTKPADIADPVPVS